MATSVGKTRSGKRRYELAVNSYDRTATLLLALLTMVGVAVAGLSIVFFANKFVTTIEPIEFVPVEATSPNANQGVAEEPDPPGIEEAPDLSEPQLQDTLDSLTSLVSANQALLAEDTIDAADKAGQGEGLGDARQAGPGGDGVLERVPRWERWKIRWEPGSSKEFVAWMDQYDVRIGVLGRDNQIHLAYRFSSGNPTTETAAPLDYNAWGRTVPADGPMPGLIRRLAEDAGVAQYGRLAVLFFPFDVERVLYTLEKAKNPSGDPNRIRETVFTVVREGAGYTFEVLQQRYF
jgi:hypothetical protein